MVEMRSIVRLDKEWPHPLIFEKVYIIMRILQ